MYPEGIRPFRLDAVDAVWIRGRHQRDILEERLDAHFRDGERGMAECERSDHDLPRLESRNMAQLDAQYQHTYPPSSTHELKALKIAYGLTPAAYRLVKDVISIVVVLQDMLEDGNP
jgi:hypothetical protein